MKITIPEAEAILKKYVKGRYLLDHSLESASGMRELAKHFGEDSEKWYIAGLLHDLDWEETENDVAQHGVKSAEYISEAGFDDGELLQAIKSHNFMNNGVGKASKMDICLSAAENSTGLIYAYILMRPDHSLEGVEAKSIIKKYKNRAFAANVNREAIAEVEKIGLELPEFFKLMLQGFKNVLDKIEI